MKLDFVVPELIPKPKYFAPVIPLILALLGFAVDFFVVLVNSLWFWGLYIAFYAYLFLEKWKSSQLRKSQQEEAKRFIFPNTEREIKALTYNIFLRPPFVKNNFDDFKNERLQGFIENVLHKQTFDVILLQEIFALGTARQRKLVQIARKAGYLFHVRGIGIPLFSKKFVDAGLLILSKFPIVERDALLYKHGNQIDSWTAKQMIYAKIQVSKTQYLHLFTTHMQASYNDSAPHQNIINDSSRLGQVDELSAFVHSKISNSPFPALIAGDFNIHARVTAQGNSEESQEYKYLITKLNRESASCSPIHCPVRDLLKEHSDGKHPNTYADICSEGKPRETVLTDPVDLGSALSIDHCLFIDTLTNLESCGIVIKENSTKVEEFLVTPPIYPFTQLSDHYGISTVLTVNPEVEVQ